MGSARDNLSISAHGRRVAFDSDDAHLVSGDTNAHEDAFERYRG